MGRVVIFADRPENQAETARMTTTSDAGDETGDLVASLIAEETKEPDADDPFRFLKK